MRAFVFPGQGSQTVGMGQALYLASPTAREAFQEVDDALGQNLSQLMFRGPPDQLTLTENAQPAIMAVSIAVLRVLERDAGIKLVDAAAYVAGHSLGEYSALCAAGALDLATTARLLKRRGQAMQQATPAGAGAMAALLGLDLAGSQAAAAEAAQGDVCAAANDNAPGQVVISGNRAAVERGIEIAKSKGAKRSMMLDVSAPFHCALMQPAADVMADVLATTALQAPFVPLIANVTAAPVAEPEQIRALLIQQVTHLVRWRESVEALAGLGVHGFVEIGAGKVLSGLIRRTYRDGTTQSLETMDDIDALVRAL